MQPDVRGHTNDDTECIALGWVCIPSVVESCGAWGKVAQQYFLVWLQRMQFQFSLLSYTPVVSEGQCKGHPIEP